MNKDTLTKCQRILSMFDELAPRPYIVHPKRKSSEGSSSAGSPARHDYSFKKLQKSRNKSTKSISNTSNSKSRLTSQSKHLKTNNSFVSPYDRQTRLDKIMKLKVKPQIRHSVTSASRISMSSVDKQNRFFDQNSQKKMTRLDKIMKLKVQKPAATSFIANYQPRKSKPHHQPRPSQPSPILQLRQCRKQAEKVTKQSEREDRLWKNFQRERQKSIVSKSKEHQKQELQIRRTEKKLETMVTKALAKIEAERDNEYHRKKAFSQYLFG